MHLATTLGAKDVWQWTEQQQQKKPFHMEPIINLEVGEDNKTYKYIR